MLIYYIHQFYNFFLTFYVPVPSFVSTLGQMNLRNSLMSVWARAVAENIAENVAENVAENAADDTIGWWSQISSSSYRVIGFAATVVYSLKDHIGVNLSVLWESRPQSLTDVVSQGKLPPPVGPDIPVPPGGSRISDMSFDIRTAAIAGLIIILLWSSCYLIGGEQKAADELAVLKDVATQSLDIMTRLVNETSTVVREMSQQTTYIKPLDNPNNPRITRAEIEFLKASCYDTASKASNAIMSFTIKYTLWKIAITSTIVGYFWLFFHKFPYVFHSSAELWRIKLFYCVYAVEVLHSIITFVEGWVEAKLPTVWQFYLNNPISEWIEDFMDPYIADVGNARAAWDALPPYHWDSIFYFGVYWLSSGVPLMIIAGCFYELLVKAYVHIYVRLMYYIFKSMWSRIFSF